MDKRNQKSKNPESGKEENNEKEKKKGMQIEGYQVEGLSIGGHETCIIFPSLNLAFDIGRCPQRALSQDFLFISHGHMDHIVSYSLSSVFILSCVIAFGSLILVSSSLKLVSPFLLTV